MATHERQHLDRILELFEDIGTEMGLLEKETPAVAAEQTTASTGELTVSGAVTVRPIVSRKERLEFIRMAWDLYRNDPNWVPPLEMDRMRLIDTEKNPFYTHARTRLFVAEKGGKIVGRIGAITNDRHNQIHDDRVGFFGFFESVDDQDVANTLISSASAWLREQGMTEVRGPISPSMNDEVGLLVEGFDSPAVVQMPYNPSYYTTLLENAGFTKAKDMLAWMIEYPQALTPKLRRVTDLLKERGNISIRGLSMKKFPDEVERIKRIYNEAWQPNWGFVPMTDEEMNLMAYELKQVIDPDLVLFAEKDGQTVGFALALPDINQAFKAGSAIPPGAKNLPTAIMNLMTKKKQIKQARIIILGVMPRYQGKGIDAMLYREIMERAAKKGITRGEASWVLEDNTMMNRAAEMMQATPYKRYRVYQKPLG
jgi:GNAT superfamily N-acetyltransferase